MPDFSVPCCPAQILLSLYTCYYFNVYFSQHESENERSRLCGFKFSRFQHESEVVANKMSMCCTIITLIFAVFVSFWLLVYTRSVNYRPELLQSFAVKS